MTCPSRAQLAAFASSEDVAAANIDGAPDATDVGAHVAACVRCRRTVEAQRSVRALAGALPPPSLSRPHRERLAAELMARADHDTPDRDTAVASRHRRRAVAIAVALTAAAAVAAAAVAVIAVRRPWQSATRTPDTASATRTPDTASATRTPDTASASRTPDTASATRTPDTASATRTPDTASASRTPDTASASRTPDTASASRTPDTGSGLPTAVAASGSADRGSADRGSAARGSADRGSADRGSAARGSAARGSADRGSADRGIAAGGSADRGSAPSSPVPRSPSPTPRAPARIEGDPSTFERTIAGTRDIIRIHDGEVTVDARDARPVEIASPTSTIRIGPAKAAIVARGGVIQTITVIAGSVEISNHGHRQIIVAGTIWKRDATQETALAAFRIGWTALRAGRHADAIAAFDRALDPVIVEDATYWAAVASQRAGDLAGARRRFTDFLSRFPDSPRVRAARAALDRHP